MLIRRSDPLWAQFMMRIVLNSFAMVMLILVAYDAELIHKSEPPVIDVCVGYENSCLAEWGHR